LLLYLKTLKDVYPYSLILNNRDFGNTIVAAILNNTDCPVFYSGSQIILVRFLTIFESLLHSTQKGVLLLLFVKRILEALLLRVL